MTGQVAGTYHCQKEVISSPRDRRQESESPACGGSVNIKTWSSVIARPLLNILSDCIIDMATLEEVALEDEIDQEIRNSSTDDIINRTRLLENDIKVPSRKVLE